MPALIPAHTPVNSHICSHTCTHLHTFTPLNSHTCTCSHLHTHTLVLTPLHLSHTVTLTVFSCLHSHTTCSHTCRPAHLFSHHHTLTPAYPHCISFLWAPAFIPLVHHAAHPCSLPGPWSYPLLCPAGPYELTCQLALLAGQGCGLKVHVELTCGLGGCDCPCQTSVLPLTPMVSE